LFPETPYDNQYVIIHRSKALDRYSIVLQCCTNFWGYIASMRFSNILMMWYLIPAIALFQCRIIFLCKPFNFVVHSKAVLAVMSASYY